MIINENTKIASVLTRLPRALDEIISVNSRFAKWRNPILRKVFAGRVTLAMAAKIGHCNITDLYNKLTPLGFEIGLQAQPAGEQKNELPDFVTLLKPEDIVELDLRPVISSGREPINVVVEKIMTIKSSQSLKIVNSFPLGSLIIFLEKMGFISHTNIISKDIVETYFIKNDETSSNKLPLQVADTRGWKEVVTKFKDHIQTIDLRALETVLTMSTILGELKYLPAETAFFFVMHTRLPVFFLTKLEDRKFNYRIKVISDGEVNLLIYKS